MAGKHDDLVNKPDPFRVFAEKVIGHFAANMMQAYALLGIIVLLFAAAAGWYLYSANYENKARIIYDKALVAGMQGSVDRKEIIKISQEVIAKYPRSRAAAMASYLMGNTYYHLGDPDEAIKAYREFLKRAASDNPLTTLVYGGLGYCYESKRDFKNALAAYEHALKSAGGDRFEVMNYRNAARMHEALNNPAQALEYYKKALAKNTDPSLDVLLKKKISTLS